MSPLSPCVMDNVCIAPVDLLNGSLAQYIIIIYYHACLPCFKSDSCLLEKFQLRCMLALMALRCFARFVFLSGQRKLAKAAALVNGGQGTQQRWQFLQHSISPMVFLVLESMATIFEPGATRSIVNLHGKGSPASAGRQFQSEKHLGISTMSSTFMVSHFSFGLMSSKSTVSLLISFSCRGSGRAISISISR